MTPTQFRSTRINQIKKQAQKFEIDCFVKYAQTGTAYLTLTSYEDNEVTVRVSNHPDVYATSDFNCDPFEFDDYKKVKAWIKENAESDAIKTVSKERSLKAKAVHIWNSLELNEHGRYKLLMKEGQRTVLRDGELVSIYPEGAKNKLYYYMTREEMISQPEESIKRVLFSEKIKNEE